MDLSNYTIQIAVSCELMFNTFVNWSDGDISPVVELRETPLIYMLLDMFEYLVFILHGQSAAQVSFITSPMGTSLSFNFFDSTQHFVVWPIKECLDISLCMVHLQATAIIKVEEVIVTLEEDNWVK